MRYSKSEDMYRAKATQSGSKDIWKEKNTTKGKYPYSVIVLRGSPMTDTDLFPGLLLIDKSRGRYGSKGLRRGFLPIDG